MNDIILKDLEAIKLSKKKKKRSSLNLIFISKTRAKDFLHSKLNISQAMLWIIILINRRQSIFLTHHRANQAPKRNIKKKALIRSVSASIQTVNPRLPLLCNSLSKVQCEPLPPCPAPGHFPDHLSPSPLEGHCFPEEEHQSEPWNHNSVVDKISIFDSFFK